MKIETLGELKKLIAMLQTQGVEICKVDGIELVLRPLPEKPGRASKQPTNSIIDNFGDINANTQIPVPQTPKAEIPDSFESMTDEQKLFYSSAPGGVESGPGN